MAKDYAPNFAGLRPLFDGKSAAGGKLYAYRAGSSIPAPLFDEDGVELGSWVGIDSNGCADFLLSSALTYKLVVKDANGATLGEWDNVSATNAPGMTNPLTAEGSLIVGGTAGEPTELPAGSEGQALKIVSGVPAWATDAEGMQNPMTTEGDLIVGSTDGEPSRLGVGAAGEVLTSDGTTAIWAAPATQPGDHKTAVDGADSSPDYLAAKLSAGTGISLTNTGSAVQIAATAQTGDHQLLVSATDASAGYLGAKLTAGSNITLTQQTDGDGVQSIEISAAGGGGGGGDFIVQSAGVANSYIQLRPSGSTKSVSWLRSIPLQNCKLKRVMLRYVNATYAPPLFEICIYEDVSYNSITLVERQKNLVLQNVGARHMLQWVDLNPITLGDKSYYIGILAGIADADQTKDINLAVDLTATECISSTWSCPSIPAISVNSRVLQGNWGGQYLRGDYTTLPDSFNGTYTNKLWPLPWTAYVCGH